MPYIHDAEFGDIMIKRQPLARQVHLRISPSGQLIISLPTAAPRMAAQLLIKGSRRRIRAMLHEYYERSAYTHDQPIGKSHHLLFQSGDKLDVTRTGTTIIVTVPPEHPIQSATAQRHIKPAITQALRKEAKGYLPRRLRWLADQHGLDYQTVKITHASSRWGSCSSKGTISLNIALMTLPFELLDYVLIHELAHTREMNHSPSFWRIVEQLDPQYQQHCAALKAYTPHL